MTQLELVDGLVRGAAFLASLKGARITVIGLARQTTAAARLLHAAGAQVRVEPVFTTAALTREQLIVITAAAALDSPAVTAARAAGVVVLGDLDLGWCATEADTLAVAGGPMAGAAVRFARAVLARLGRPLLVAGGTEPDLVVSAPAFGGEGLVLVEPSPAQLATAQVFRPRVAVLMGGLGGHVGARPSSIGRLLAQQTPRDCLVLDADDEEAHALARHARARVLWCRISGALDHGIYVARGRIAARLNAHVEEICPIEGLPRNVLPAALAAVACALWAGMAPDAIGEALLPGRLAATTPPQRVAAATWITPPERAGEAREPASSMAPASSRVLP